MMHLDAICVGYAVPCGNFDTEVHSAFSSAANLRLMRSKRLLTLVTVNAADLPQGIRLDTPHGFTFEGLTSEERVSCRDGVLHFEQTPLTIDLRPAKSWKCDLPGLAANMKDPSILAAWQSVRQVLDDWRRDKGTGLPASQSIINLRLYESVSDLIAATRECDNINAAEVVGTLIGLGPGLTPAGDDFLVGYLAGLWCAAGEKPERVRFLLHLGKAVTRLSRQTNDISRTYLVQAARGQVSSRLASLAEAICKGEHSDHLREVTEAALQMGHDSGMQSVTGLLLGLSIWEGDFARSTPWDNLLFDLISC